MVVWRRPAAGATKETGGDCRPGGGEDWTEVLEEGRLSGVLRV